MKVEAWESKMHICEWISTDLRLTRQTGCRKAWPSTWTFWPCRSCLCCWNISLWLLLKSWIHRSKLPGLDSKLKPDTVMVYASSLCVSCAELKADTGSTNRTQTLWPLHIRPPLCGALHCEEIMNAWLDFLGHIQMPRGKGLFFDRRIWNQAADWLYISW